MTQIKLRRDTAANFTSKNPVLGVGEPAYETDTKKLKIGDGTTAYTQLEYFSAGGGGSTNITATLPLKIVDGVISLEVDGQTIQIVDGKLHANLDELGNEVNTLAGEVTSVQADLLKKQDKLTPKLPLKIDVASDERVFGFTINTQNNQMHADANQKQTMFFGFGQNNAIDTNKVHSYIKIPYSVGQLLELPYKPTQYSEDANYVNRTAMLPGWFGHTNEDGTISPVVTASMRSNWAGNSYDQQSTYLFTSFENNAGVYTNKKEILCSEELGFNTGSASRPTVFVQINSATNSFDIQFPKGGYLNPDYTKYWTAGSTGFAVSDYPTIDCFIYCPPGQESINTNFFGLYNSETRLRNGMMGHAESNANIFSFEGVDTSYLQLDIGSGLAITDGKLTANLDELNNPYSLFDSKYSDHELYNLSWLKSEGQQNAKAVYTGAYDKLLKVHNGTETVEGLSVKLSTETYTDYDYVINTTDETFRLPLLNGSEDLPSNTVLKRIDNATLPVGTTNLFTASHNGNVSIKVFSTTGGNTITAFRNGVLVGAAGFPANAYNQSTISFDVKRGDVVGVNLDGGTATYNYLYSKAVGNGSLYYYVGETVQNTNLIDAGKIGEELVNIKASIDGDWTYKKLSFADSFSLPINTEGAGGVFTYDLSNYLPNDGYKYEVTISVEVNNSSFCTLGYYLPDNSWYSFAKGGNPIGSWFNAIVDSSRQVKISVVNTQEALMWAVAAAYRRLGKKV